MAQQRETNSYNHQVDKFTQALATAREMQQDWLTYGINFIHIYVEDVHGDWLETWGKEEIFTSSTLDTIKEFLVSNDIVAVRLRQFVGERSLFEIAVNLEELWQIPQHDERLTAIKSLLKHDNTSDGEVSDLANSLLRKLSQDL